MASTEHTYCDKGYKGNIKVLDKTEIHPANKKKKSMKAREWQWYQRRNSIEPIIGHTKQDHQPDS